MISVGPQKVICEDTIHSGISRSYSLSNDKEQIGIARFDITPQAIIFHMDLFNIKNRKEFLFDCAIIARTLMKKYQFNFLYYCTDRAELIKIMSDNKAFKIGENSGWLVYAHKYEDI